MVVLVVIVASELVLKMVGLALVLVVWVGRGSGPGRWRFWLQQPGRSGIENDFFCAFVLISPPPCLLLLLSLVLTFVLALTMSDISPLSSSPLVQSACHDGRDSRDQSIIPTKT